jgi:nitroreductase
MLDLTADQVLTTTRSVRKRLDLTRPVPRALIAECLEIAFQAPNGSNRNTWQWVVVDDRALLKQVAAIYDAAMEDFITSDEGQAYQRQAAAAVTADPSGAVLRDMQKMSASVDHLRRHMADMPALVIPMLMGRPHPTSVFYQASPWGSILPAVWSLFLALRARGLGSAWTTVHLLREAEMAALLGIPYDRYTQAGLFPIAYTLGADFKVAWRKPAAEVVSWNRFGER